ncbi:MAG: hypothetical protein V7K64_28180 [Nostoc sp.]|uniref:hypothetical protein n=1 Tax=unclassified Nostoc TaxID=2593658 RepID=UPI001D4F3F21|nr:hypothetical protein [Nostoc sp. JL34]MBN3882602.1 hypothetical protein [Nostoc sp. JL34]
MEVAGECGYLTLLPTPIHDFKAAREWLDEEIFHHHLDPQDMGKIFVQVVETLGAGIVGVLVAINFLKMLGSEEKKEL